MKSRKWKALAWDDKPASVLDDLKRKLQSDVDLVITNQIDDFDGTFRNCGPWDFVILDIIDDTSDPEYPSKVGMRLAANVRAVVPNIPIVFLTDGDDLILSGEITTPKPTLLKSKSYSKGLLSLDIKEFVRENLVPYDYSKVFIIYGHGRKASGFKDKVVSKLKSRSVEPVLLSPETEGNSISDALVSAMKPCGAFIAICTPDDHVVNPNETLYQPRQNVLLEIGMAMALSEGFKRLVILQRWGAEPEFQARLSSDLGGAFTIKFYDEHEEPINQMIDALIARNIALLK